MHVESIGRQLREARERKGVSLSEAAAATRIKPTQLEAMERGDFSSMAAPLYLKGFIKIYSKYLHLDTESLIQETFASQSPGAPQALAPENTSRMLQKKNPPPASLAPPVDRFATPGAESSVEGMLPTPIPPSAAPGESSGLRTKSTVHIPKMVPTVTAPQRGGISVTARKLQEAQAGLNAGTKVVEPLPPAPVRVVAPVSLPENSTVPDFDFGEKPPAADPLSEPDLFAFVQERKTLEEAETPIPTVVIPPASHPLTALESDKEPKAAPILTALAPPPHVRTSVYRRPSKPVPERAKEFAASGAQWLGRIARHPWISRYGPRAAVLAVAVVAAFFVVSGLRSCGRHAGRSGGALPANAPSGIWKEAPVPYQHPDLVGPGRGA